MSVYLTDTHPLVWFTLNKQNQLSPKARAAFESAEAGRAFVYVPAIVLWETALLERAGRIKLNGGFLRWAEKILSSSGFGLAPLEPEIISLGAGYNFNGDPFDEAITAFAAHLDVPLITKDAAITNAGLVEIYW